MPVHRFIIYNTWRELLNITFSVYLLWFFRLYWLAANLSWVFMTFNKDVSSCTFSDFIAPLCSAFRPKKKKKNFFCLLTAKYVHYEYFCLVFQKLLYDIRKQSLSLKQGNLTMIHLQNIILHHTPLKSKSTSLFLPSFSKYFFFLLKDVKQECCLFSFKYML